MNELPMNAAEHPDTSSHHDYMVSNDNLLRIKRIEKAREQAGIIQKAAGRGAICTYRQLIDPADLEETSFGHLQLVGWGTVLGGHTVLGDQGLGHRVSHSVSASLPAEPKPHLHPDRETLKEEVRRLLEHAGEEDWDGEGAQALSPETVEIAVGLASTFPAGIDTPMISATPHGEVDFDWALSRDIMLTVSVGPSGDVVFAGLFDETELNGREPWKNDLPQFVMCCFERLKVR